MLDHIVYGVRDLDHSVPLLEEKFGVEAAQGGRHPDRGTHNALFGLDGGAYIEVIGPDPDQPEPDRPRPFGLDYLEHSRLITWCIRPEEFDTQVRVALERGYDPGELVSMSRELPNGSILEWRLATHSGTGLRSAGDGLVPFLIDWGASPHPSQMTGSGIVLHDLFGEHPEPSSVGPMLKALGVTLNVRQAPRPALVATLETPNGKVELR